ncbi:MAG: FAD-dependent oxidoreductase [Candidatus Marinamargulisbacteria bacterium]
MSPYSQQMDVVIVGGGITGAGVALDASRRGLQVALFEQQDFGIGASTATSKLAHGGLRYLEQRQFKLVKESLNERNFLLNSAPHLVKPLQFYVPIYKGSRWKKWQLAIGLRVYDWIQTNRQLPKHVMHGMARLQQDVPWLKTAGLLGCGSYYDAQMEDHRLIIESLLMAQAHGAHIHNYSKVTNINETSSGLGFDVSSRTSGKQSMAASSMVVATGAWNNQFASASLVKPTKGIHIVLPDMDLAQALLLMTPQDDRVFFMMPWYGKTLVGTTDDKDDGHYTEPRVTQAEANYLLTAVNAYHTQRIWQLSDIESVFCGYRPLIATDESSPSSQTREETYTWLKKSVLSISGGKYTTFRKMGQTAVNALTQQAFQNKAWYNARQLDDPYIGYLAPDDWPSEAQLNQLSSRYRVSRESLLHLIETYGALYKDILNTIQYHPEYAVRFDFEHPMILAELKYAIEKEWVKTPADFLLRRTYYGHALANKPDVLAAICKQFYQMVGASDAAIGADIDGIVQRLKVSE